MKQVKAFIGFA